jgi:PKD repeat protein
LGINLIYKVQTKRINHVEGWGSLTTPYSNFASVLKLRTELFHTDTLFFDTLTIPIPPTTDVEFSWFEPNTKIPVLKVSGNEANGNIIYSQIEFTDTIRCIQPQALSVYSPLIPFTNTEINFNNTSVNSDTYQWDFDDPSSGTLNTSTLANPSHTYTASGNYLVHLIACNSICQPQQCDTVTIPIVILDSSEVVSDFSFSPLQPCLGDTVQFSNESLNANIYQWSFGDSSNSILANPKHVYTSSGTYSVRLIARNVSDADTLIQQITIGTPPTATITASGSLNLCNGDTVTLYASGGDFYQWNTGVVTEDISVTATGTFFVTAVNNCGSDVSQSVTVNFFSQVQNTFADTICSGSTYNFNGTLLSQSGTYSDTLTSVNGCDSISSLSLTVQSLPAPVISLLGYDTLATSLFNSYQWLFEGNLVNGAVQQQYLASQNGYYAVFVTDEYGCSDTSAEYHFVITMLTEKEKNVFGILYPNPSCDKLIIEAASFSGSNGTIKMVDEDGSVVLSQTVLSEQWKNPVTLNIHDLASGIYLVVLSNRNQQFIKRIVKER